MCKKWNQSITLPLKTKTKQREEGKAELNNLSCWKIWPGEGANVSLMNFESQTPPFCNALCNLDFIEIFIKSTSPCSVVKADQKLNTVPG